MPTAIATSAPLTASHTRPHWLLRTGLITALLILIGLAYHTAPRNSFHFDDAANIVRHGPVHMTEPGIEAIFRAAREGLLPQRVLPNISFAIDWWRGNGDPAPFLITNIIIHAATAIATLALLLLVFQRSGAPPLTAWLFASAATAIWALHPIQVQAVTYVVQRMASMVALFMLITVIAYVRGRLTRRHGLWYPIAILAAIAAWFSKENAYILPALVLLAEYTLCREAGDRIRSHADRAILALPLLITAYVILDLAVFQGPVSHYVVPGYAHRDFTLSERLLTQPRVIFFHLGQMLIPLPERFSIEHEFALSRNLWTPWTTPLALAGILIWIVAGAWLALRSRIPAVGFLVLWVPATLAVESSVIALEMVFEHRMYLPSVGLAGLAGLGLMKLTERRLSIAAILIGLVTAGLFTATLYRIPTWRTPVTLYEHAVRHAPGVPRAWTNLATAYEDQDRSLEAVAAYTRALSLEPNRAIAHLNRGSSHRKLGDFIAAEADYRRFMELEPDDYRGPYALGALHAAAGRYDEAIQWLSAANRLNARTPLPLRELADVYFATGRPDATITALEDARGRDPAIATDEYFDLLGAAYGRLGRYDEAIEAFGRALRMNPAHGTALLYRAFAYLRSGKLDAALADFDSAITGMPDNARAHYGRAETLMQLGRHSEALTSARRSLALDPAELRAAQIIGALETNPGR
ncbi:tetratricopeptide repeat protein [Aromatoleum toluclasticum]|uniref:tetratricopeptide repeat protein n=1 Tax=Aromatoleum toluclasticum TaxID=92003 RepID=UPI0003782AFA|nr:tetratricopeptide repeat protein [Aromatoleum toluclasticum]